MQLQGAYKAEGIAKQLWMIYYYLHPQNGTYGEIGRLIKGFNQEQTSNISKKCQLFKTE